MKDATNFDLSSKRQPLLVVLGIEIFDEPSQSGTLGLCLFGLLDVSYLTHEGGGTYCQNSKSTYGLVNSQEGT